MISTIRRAVAVLSMRNRICASWASAWSGRKKNKVSLVLPVQPQLISEGAGHLFARWRSDHAGRCRQQRVDALCAGGVRTLSDAGPAHRPHAYPGTESAALCGGRMLPGDPQCAVLPGRRSIRTIPIVRWPMRLPPSCAPRAG